MHNAAPLPDWCLKLPALSIRQPWAWLILNAGKNIENRTWQTHFRGWFLIHAAKGCTQNEFDDAMNFACDAGFRTAEPALSELPRGGIVGVAKLGSCTRASESPWFVGDWGFVLDEVRPLPFVPCKGALGFFKPQF